jgi:hypothetical protein
MNKALENDVIKTDWQTIIEPSAIFYGYSPKRLLKHDNLNLLTASSKRNPLQTR